jgi:hypothetical protein
MRKLVFALSLALIFTIPWEGALVSKLGTISTVVGIFVTLLWVAMILMTGQVRKPGTFLQVMSIFVLWISLTAFWSADPPNSVGAVLRWIGSLLFAFIVWDLYRTRGEVLKGLQAWILGEYVSIAAAFLNFHGSHAYYTNYQRFAPGNTNPDGFGFTVALGIPVACYLAAAPETSRRARLVNLAYLPVGFLGISLSGTRTASIAAVIGVLYGLAVLTHIKASSRLVVIALLVVGMFVVFPIVHPLKSFDRFATTAN